MKSITFHEIFKISMQNTTLVMQYTTFDDVCGYVTSKFSAFYQLYSELHRIKTCLAIKTFYI